MRDKRGTLKIVIAVLICVVVIGGFAALGVPRVYSSGGGGGAKASKNAVAAQVEETYADTVITKVSTSGKVDFIEKATLYASTSAKALSLKIKAGDLVKLGDVIIEYDEETLTQLNRSLEDAKLQVKTAEINLKNAKAPTITEAEELNAQTQIRNAESAVNSASKSVSDINAQIDQADINYASITRAHDTAEQNYKNTKLLYDAGAASKRELDSASDAVDKALDQLKTAESQRETLLQSLASANRAVTDARSNLESAQKSQDITDRQIAANSGKLRNSADLAAVSLEQAKRAVEKLEKDIEDFKETEYAKASGSVLSLSATEGQMLAKGQLIAVVADTTWNNLVITTYVPENDTGAIALGQTVEISGGSLGKQVYLGKVTKILPIAENRQIGSTTEAAVTVEITPDDKDIPIKAGFTVDTNIITRVAENVVVCPLMAVMTEGSGASYVFALDSDNIAHRRDVKMLAFSNLYVEVEGLGLGERVVVNPGAAIAEGVAVKPSLY